MNEQFINDLSKELAKLGTIHSVGEEWISYTGKIPSGGIPYCGQEVTRETYSALWSWVQAQGLVKTESEWQSLASSQNGNVPFYSSGNGTTTFRMPKIVGYVKGASSQSESGSYVAEGLPNITGKSTYNMIADNFGAEGAFDLSGRAAHQNGTAMGEGSGLGFNASLSNPIYGNSGHVTPETSVVLFGVYAFGTVSNPSDLSVYDLASDVDNIKTSYLPLSGGTLEGKVEIKGNGEFRNFDDGHDMAILGGSNWENGAFVQVTGQSHLGGGQFQFAARSGSGSSFLQGFPWGSLLWQGVEIERVAESGVGYVRYHSGLQICYGKGGTNDIGGCYIGFPVPFTDIPEVLPVIHGSMGSGGNWCILYEPIDGTAGSVWAFLPNGGHAQVGFSWIAVGPWK